MACIGTFRLKMLYDCDFLLHNVRHVLELMHDLLSIRMFDDLDYCIRIEHEVLKISHGEVIITKGYKICGLYILEASNVAVDLSSASEDFYDKNNP